MTKLTIGELRKAVAKLKDHEVKGDLQLEIRNWPLFEKMLKAGEIYECRPGVYELRKEH